MHSLGTGERCIRNIYHPCMVPRRNQSRCCIALGCICSLYLANSCVTKSASYLPLQWALYNPHNRGGDPGVVSWLLPLLLHAMEACAAPRFVISPWVFLMEGVREGWHGSQQRGWQGGTTCPWGLNPWDGCKTICSPQPWPISVGVHCPTSNWQQCQRLGSSWKCGKHRVWGWWGSALSPTLSGCSQARRRTAAPAKPLKRETSLPLPSQIHHRIPVASWVNRSEERFQRKQGESGAPPPRSDWEKQPAGSWRASLAHTALPAWSARRRKGLGDAPEWGPALLFYFSLPGDLLSPTAWTGNLGIYCWDWLICSLGTSEVPVVGSLAHTLHLFFPFPVFLISIFPLQV